MRGIFKMFIIASIIGAISTGSMFNDKEEQLSGREAALNGEMPIEELEENGVMGYLASKTSGTLYAMSNEGKEAELSDWERSFINNRESIGNGVMVIDYAGATIPLNAESDSSQIIRLRERHKALQSATVTVNWTQEQLFEYIRNYYKYGYSATISMEDKVKADTGCKYDLRFDYIYVDSNNIVLTMIYDNGVETDLAIGLSEAVAFVYSLVDYI